MGAEHEVLGSNFKLPRLSMRDLETLNHAAELLDAAHQAVMTLNAQGKTAIGHLLYESQQEIFKVRDKGLRAIARREQRQQDQAGGEESDNGSSGAV